MSPETIQAIVYVALLYGRASRDPFKLERSIKSQFRDLLRARDRNEWRPYHRHFSDTDLSASPYARKKREDYDEMVSIVSNSTGLEIGERFIILVWEAARLSRNLEHFFELRKVCQDTGTLIYLFDEDTVFDMNITSQKQRLTELVHKAEIEADKTQARVARATNQNTEDGGVHGRIPYGYRRTYDPDTGELVGQFADERPMQCGESPAEIVAEIKKRAAAQESIESMKASLEERGVLSPDGTPEWSRSTIRNIAMSPVYMGKRVHRGEVIGDGQWPALTTDEMHYAAVAVLSDPSRVTHHGVAPSHLLSNIPLCGAPGSESEFCGSRLRADSGPNQRRSPSLKCHRRGCQRVGINEPTIDLFVQAALLAWCEKPGRAEAILAAFEDEDSREAHAEVARLEAELAEARRLSSLRQLSPAGLAAAESGILPALKLARGRITPVSPLPALTRLVGPDARAVWADMDDLSERRAVIRSTMEIRVMPIGRGRMTEERLIERVKIRWLLGA
jgi:site-specific DNA recombinase